MKVYHHRITEEHEETVDTVRATRCRGYNRGCGLPYLEQMVLHYIANNTVLVEVRTPVEPNFLFEDDLHMLQK